MICKICPIKKMCLDNEYTKCVYAVYRKGCRDASKLKNEMKTLVATCEKLDEYLLSCKVLNIPDDIYVPWQQAMFNASRHCELAEPEKCSRYQPIKAI